MGETVNREDALTRLANEKFDVLVIGGGATGVGCALDAASRGYATALIDAHDFAKGTSSRSTKLVHGGVRYLRQGNVALVREALRERARLRDNAPDYVRELPFFIPAKSGASLLFYAAGLKLYDALAGPTGFPKSRIVDGGILYWDAQFDDARVAIAIARTAWAYGAAVCNYVRARAFRYDCDRICGVEAADVETGAEFPISARVAINATGIFSDSLRVLDDARATPMIAFSRGSHIVADKALLPVPSRALVVPKTPDGRVIFAIPWQGCALVGTTDVPAPSAEIEPRPADEEIDFLIRTASPYLAAPIARDTVRSVFAGLRPLVNRRAASTERMSREHAVTISASGLVTVAGGKWTTYRQMAQDAVDTAAREGGLTPTPCKTVRLPLQRDDAPEALDARTVHAAKVEMARTIEDVLARRTTRLFTDAAQAQAQASTVARALAGELERDENWIARQVAAFVALAESYKCSGMGEARPEANSAV